MEEKSIWFWNLTIRLRMRLGFPSASNGVAAGDAPSEGVFAEDHCAKIQDLAGKDR